MEYYKTRRRNKEKHEIATAFSGLHTSARNISVPMIGIECLLTVWIEVCNQKSILLKKERV
jgi:hypothetical protein